MFITIVFLILPLFNEEDTINVFGANYNLKNFIGFAQTVWGVIIVEIVLFWKSFKGKILLYIRTQTPFLRKKFMRFSFAYLYRIKIGDEYVLTKNNNIADMYQPVGGVYERYKDSDELFNKLEILTDDCLRMTEKNEMDLRGKLRRKNLIRLLDWFDSCKQREVSPWREFNEEMIKTEILEARNFPYLDYKFIKQVRVKFKFSEPHNCTEYKIFDIYEPIYKEAQKIEISELKDSELIKRVKRNLIEKLGHDSETGKTNFRIGEQTKFIL